MTFVTDGDRAYIRILVAGDDYPDHNGQATRYLGVGDLVPLPIFECRELIHAGRAEWFLGGFDASPGPACYHCGAALEFSGGVWRCPQCNPLVR